MDMICHSFMSVEAFYHAQYFYTFIWEEMMIQEYKNAMQVYIKIVNTWQMTWYLLGCDCSVCVSYCLSFYKRWGLQSGHSQLCSDWLLAGWWCNTRERTVLIDMALYLRLLVIWCVRLCCLLNICLHSFYVHLLEILLLKAAVAAVQVFVAREPKLKQNPIFIWENS